MGPIPLSQDTWVATAKGCMETIFILSEAKNVYINTILLANNVGLNPTQPTQNLRASRSIPAQVSIKDCIVVKTVPPSSFPPSFIGFNIPHCAAVFSIVLLLA